MNNVDHDTIKEFVSMLKNVSAQKYYRANPYTKTDGLDFKGNVSEKLFFDSFYVETEKSKQCINDIKYVLNNYPESTIILKGYSGCGKTSFLHDLLYNNIKSSIVIDCEKGIDNQDEDPILTKITFDIVERINDDIINNNSIVLNKVKEIFTMIIKIP